MRTTMKKMMAMTMAMMVAFSLIGCKGQKNYDMKLLDEAEKVGVYLDQQEKIEYSVSKNFDTYQVTLDGEKKIVKFTDESEEPDALKKDLGELKEERSVEAYEFALGKVKEYVLQSRVIKKKQQIIDQLNDLKVRNADLNVADGLCREGKLYINEALLKEMPKWAIRWCMCHELMHALSDITTNGEKRYYASPFDETLTDLITASMFVDDIMHDSKCSKSCYYRYYQYTLGYISCFKENAIYAYFYGYENLFKLVDRDELDFLVLTYDQLEESEFPHTCVYASLTKWRK